MQKRNFVRKKVKSLTLGEKLQQLRGGQGLSVEDLSKNINVKVVYIDALEKGQYDKLPTKVYAKGFVRSYARFFGVPEDLYLNMFDKEYSIYQNINHKDDEEEVNKLPKIPRFVFTPRVLAIMGALIVLSIIGLYLYFSIDNFTSSPWLVIEEPVQNSVVDKETTLVRGITKNDSRVFINGQQIFVDRDGGFSDTINLVPGVNIITVKSINKFDKESVEEIIVDANYEIKEQEPEVAKIHVILKAQNEPIWVNVIADDIDVYNDTLQVDDEMAFDGAGQIVVTTSSGNNTLVSQDNGETFEPMSEENNIVKDYVFEGEEKQDDKEMQESETSGE
jgi:cytoskeletal protein RodZ